MRAVYNSGRHCLTLYVAIRCWQLLYLVRPPCRKKLNMRLLRALVISLDCLTVRTVRPRSLGNGCTFRVSCLVDANVYILLLVFGGSLHLCLTLASLVPNTIVNVRHGPYVGLIDWTLICAEPFPVGPHTGMWTRVEWPPRF